MHRIKATEHKKQEIKNKHTILSQRNYQDKTFFQVKQTSTVKKHFKAPSTLATIVAENGDAEAIIAVSGDGQGFKNCRIAARVDNSSIHKFTRLISKVF